MTPPLDTRSLMQRLDQRSRDIFREIVEGYLATGEPVGSRTLSKGRVQLSPASIRNVMADLTELGLIDAPHISAGRAPTHKGLRLFVDGFLELGEPSKEDRQRIDERLAAAALVEAGLAQWSGEAPGRPRSLIVRGRANLLEDAKAAEDLDRVRELFNALERQESLMDILDKTREAGGVRLFIGAENQLFPLSGSSVIVAPYMGGGKRVIGALGVIGPTRLNYARVIPMVDYTAKVVGDLLTARRLKDG